MIRKRLTVEEVANMLRVSPNHVRRLMREDLPYIQIGERTKLIDAEDLQQWLESRKVCHGQGGRR